MINIGGKMRSLTDWTRDLIRAPSKIYVIVGYYGIEFVSSLREVSDYLKSNPKARLVGPYTVDRSNKKNSKKVKKSRK
jgi:hypothetical protein